MINSKLTLIVLPMFTLLITGCFNTCPPDCPKDLPLSDWLSSHLPYEAGDTVRFNAESGTVAEFICIERSVQKQPLSHAEAQYQECCPRYFSENLQCLFSPEGDNSFRCISITVGESNSYIACSITIDGKEDKAMWYQNGYQAESIDSIHLADKSFFNVVKVNGKNPANSFYLSENALGVVGFKIDSVEWALQ